MLHHAYITTLDASLHLIDSICTLYLVLTLDWLNQKGWSGT